MSEDTEEVFLSKTLLDGFSHFRSLFSSNSMKTELVQRYCMVTERILDILKSVFHGVIISELNSSENLNKVLKQIDVCVNEVWKLVDNWHWMMSKVYFVMQIERVMTKLQTCAVETCKLLNSHISDDFCSTCVEKIQQIHSEQASYAITEAVRAQVNKTIPQSKHLEMISKSLSLSSNLELLMEVVALNKLKTKISHSENYSELESINQMIALINYMHNFHVNTNQLHSVNEVPIPDDFCCPLSLELMSDPVIVASGQTYERAFIKQWFDLGYDICPKTFQTLSHTNLVTNFNVKDLITNWCRSSNIEPPDSIKCVNYHLPSSPSLRQPISPDMSIKKSNLKPKYIELQIHSSKKFVPRIISSPSVTVNPELSNVETQVCKLIDDLKSDSIDMQRAAAAELRLLATPNMENRITIASCGGISPLINLLHSTDPKTQENSVTALLNLSLNDNNKIAIASADAIDPLIHVLENGNSTAKENAAATFLSLTVIDENKVKLGHAHVIQPLVEILKNGTPRGKKDVASALFNLSIFHGNKARIVASGAVKHLLELLDPAHGMIDKAVPVLANLSTIQEGRNAIVNGGGIPFLVDVVEVGSARGKEHAAAALLQLCTNSSRYLNQIVLEGAGPPVVVLSKTGTARAKEKAQSLLRHFRDHRQRNAGMT